MQGAPSGSTFSSADEQLRCGAPSWVTEIPMLRGRRLRIPCGHCMVPSLSRTRSWVPQTPRAQKYRSPLCLPLRLHSPPPSFPMPTAATARCARWTPPCSMLCAGTPPMRATRPQTLPPPASPVLRMANHCSVRGLSPRRTPPPTSFLAPQRLRPSVLGRSSRRAAHPCPAPRSPRSSSPRRLRTFPGTSARRASPWRPPPRRPSRRA
jgi:hypothetical protein